MQCQACDITLQIIKSQDLELHYCPRCGAMHEVSGGESCEACRDAAARDRLPRWWLKGNASRRDNRWQ